MKKLKNNQFGFGAVEILLLILVLAVVGFGGYYVWNNQHKSSTPKTTSTPTNSSVQNTSTQPESTKYLTIKEWGIKMPLSSEIDDAYYVVSTSSEDSSGKPNTVWIGLKSLDSKGCSASNGNDGKSLILAAIVKVSPSDTDPVSGKPTVEEFSDGTTIGQYYYGYSAYSGLQKGSSCTSASNVTTINNAFKKAADDISGS